MNASPTRRSAAGPVLILLVIGSQVVAQEPAAAPEPVEAVWMEHKLFFSYGSSTTAYACDTLEGRVAAIMVAVGARPDIEVNAINCSQSNVPPDARMNDPASGGSWAAASTSYLDRRADREQFVHVRVRAMMPVEVTPEVREEMKRDKSRRELVSRVTGNPAARFDDPIIFPATWQTVTLSRRTIGLEPEECELLEQISRSTFRQLGLRVVSGGHSCSPGRSSHLPPVLVVEALMGPPFETGGTRQAPAGDDEAAPEGPAAAEEEPAEPATEGPRD